MEEARISTVWRRGSVVRYRPNVNCINIEAIESYISLEREKITDSLAPVRLNPMLDIPDLLSVRPYVTLVVSACRRPVQH